MIFYRVSLNSDLILPLYTNYLQNTVPVGASLSVESLGRNRVDLIDEDDRRRVLLRQTEHVTDL